MNSCCLCADLASPKSAPIWNQPLFRTENFVVLPSLGALVEGWLLLVPTRHHFCLGALPASVTEEFQELQDLARSILTNRYGCVSAFEHGPSIPKITVGCGVDLAHLHMVSVELDLAASVRPFLPESTSWKGANAQTRSTMDTIVSGAADRCWQDHRT